jgi:hypothetical protein
VALLHKRIGQKGLCHVGGNVLSAQCDGRNLRESSSYDRKKLKTRHLRHSQVGDDQIRKRTTQALQRVEPVLGYDYFVALGLEDQPSRLPDGRFVVNEEDTTFKS